MYAVGDDNTAAFSVKSFKRGYTRYICRKAEGTGSVYQVMILQSATFSGFLTDQFHCITVKYVQNAISSVTAKGIFVIELNITLFRVINTAFQCTTCQIKCNMTVLTSKT